MRKNISIVIALLLMVSLAASAQKVKIACIGNSITFGHGINDREHFHYPAQLQRYLGDGYEVRNFGVSATTLLLKGDYPYVTTEQYKQSLEWQPDIVLIKFGTNDTKAKNWKYKDEFKSDYKALIDTYQQLASHPKVILLTPIRCFLPITDWDIRGDYVEQFIRPMVEEVAYEKGLDIINLHNIYGDTWNAAILPDKLHPSALGAGDMALKVYKHLTVKQPMRKMLAKKEPFYKQNAKTFNFHGYQGYEFEHDGLYCKVVKPKVVAEGKPWIWRARFWGHEPQTDIDLLERGFHVAYCHVGGLFGAPEAVKRWDAFYKLMRAEGFSQKMALEGMSRGGLIIYNWAAKNPKKVACIYGDAPVMDIKSWPMGSKDDDDNVKDMMKAYGFNSEAEARAWRGNPMDHARAMAKARIPILHVVGDADTGVPYKDNTQPFEQQMARLGAPISVIHKPAVGHHPHSLNNPLPIVEFIVQAMAKR